MIYVFTTIVIFLIAMRYCQVMGIPRKTPFLVKKRPPLWLCRLTQHRLFTLIDETKHSGMKPPSTLTFEWICPPDGDPKDDSTWILRMTWEKCCGYRGPASRAWRRAMREVSPPRLIGSPPPSRA